MPTPSTKNNILYGAPKCRYFYQTGAPYELQPHLPLAPISGVLPWKWFPWKFRIYAPGVVRSFAVLLFLASVGIATAVRQNIALMVVLLCVINLFFVFPLFYLAFIMVWNFKLREAVCWALGKSVQAKEVWKEATNPSDAKSVFFTIPISNNIYINVLRDGSQELWNRSGGEFTAGLNEALGQVGFEGMIFDAGGVISDSVAESAIANVPIPEERRQYGQHE